MPLLRAVAANGLGGSNFHRSAVCPGRDPSKGRLDTHGQFNPPPAPISEH